MFAVIDGKAYDFSQRNSKTSSIKKYLADAYLPSGTTESIIFMGRLTKEKALKSHIKMSMKIYDLKDYAKNYGPVLYEGSFIELFNSLDGKPSRSFGPKYSKEVIKFDSSYKLGNSQQFTNPMMKKDGIFYPIKAESFQICRAFGFMGSINSQLEFKVSDKVKMLDLGSYFSKDVSRFISSKDIRISSSFTESIGDIPSGNNFHYASSVTCSDFSSLGL